MLPERPYETERHEYMTSKAYKRKWPLPCSPESTQIQVWTRYRPESPTSTYIRSMQCSVTEVHFSELVKKLSSKPTLVTLALSTASEMLLSKYPCNSEKYMQFVRITYICYCIRNEE